MPAELNDRAADAWEPVVAIADLAGGDWPSRARAAALALSGEDVAAAKDENVDTMLLADIRAASDHFDDDKISSEVLTNYLATLEGRPWAEWGSGKPISKHQLSKRLKEYKIVSGTIRTSGHPKGVSPERFRRRLCTLFAWPPISSRHIATSVEIQRENAVVQLATEQQCGEFKNRENTCNSAVCGDVAAQQPGDEGSGQHRDTSADADADEDIVWRGIGERA